MTFHNRLQHHLPAFWFLVLVLSSLSGETDGKQLIFFAGPHKSAATSVEKFFHNHASGFNHARISDGLQGWRWPKLNADLTAKRSLPRHKVFSLLVTEAANEGLQAEMMKGIKQAWEESEHGIIIGTEEFDRVGHNPQTHYDAIAAMEMIVNKLGLSTSGVTVVLNYRTPRLEQWISLWKDSPIVASKSHYKKFVCGQEHSHELWEDLDTAMNPMKLAAKYRERGWNVALVDMSGVEKAGLDVAHVVSCDVMENTDCKDGWISDKFNRTYHENQLDDKELGSLDHNKKKELEQLFRERDCYYENRFRDDAGVQILHRDTIWRGCLNETQHLESYDRLTDMENLISIVKGQKDCSSAHTQVKDHLVGDYETMTGVGGHVYKADNNGVQNAKDKTFGNLDEIEKLPLISNKSDVESPFTVTAFLFIVVGGSVYQLYLMQQQQSSGQVNSDSLELENMRNDAQIETDQGYGDSDRMVAA